MDLDPHLVEGVRAHLARDGGDFTPHRVAEALRRNGHPVGDALVLAVYELLRRDVVGAGPLEPLLGLAGVTDVLVNGPQAVYVDRGDGLELTDVTFPDDAAVRRLAQRMAAAAGRRLDDAAPYADVRMPDGTRVHAVLAPVAAPGTVVCLRIPGRDLRTLGDLRAAGLMDDDVEAVLEQIVQRRLAMLITGGTGTGKTTLLAALLSLVPASERIVIVEDSAELRPRHPHVVGLEARPANLEGSGQIEVRTLVRQALRMRPDRLIVGEVRGAEVVDLLAALNTGHDGGGGTLHANAAASVPARIEALALAAGLSREAAHSQLAAALDVVIHLERTADGVRRIAQVAVPVRGDDGLVSLRAAVTIDRHGVAHAGVAYGHLADRLDAA